MVSPAPSPFTFLVPESRGEPIIVKKKHPALKMAIVERHQVTAAVRDWENQSGVYVLIGPTEDGRWRGYVGEAPAGLGKRLRTHRNRPDWERALLVESAARFTSTETGWLEGELIDHLAKHASVCLQNTRKAGDTTLPDYDQRALKEIVTALATVLRAIGHDPGPRTCEAQERVDDRLEGTSREARRGGPEELEGSTGKPPVRPKRRSSPRAVRWSYRGEDLPEKNAADMYEHIVAQLYEDHGGVAFYRRFRDRVATNKRSQIGESPKEADPEERSIRSLPGGWFLNVHSGHVQKENWIRVACECAGIEFGRDLIVEFSLPDGVGGAKPQGRSR